MYKKDISKQVPLLTQEEKDWCGAACAQMTRAGYPDHGFYSQQDLTNNINSHNKNAPGDPEWASDPCGMQGCLQSLSTSPVTWVERAGATRDDVLFSIFSGMDRSEFAAPVLIYGGLHWVVVVGWQISVKPVKGSHPALKHIHFYEPKWKHKGVNHFVLEATWNKYYWNDPVTVPGTWNNQYVAIVQDPAPIS
jgi:hypothetical protein